MSNFIEVKTTVRIPEQKINDLIVSAIEGGSNYWARFKFPEGYKDKYQSYEQIPMKGGRIEVFDIETDELLGFISKFNIIKGLQMMADGKDTKDKDVPSRHFKKLTTDSEDAETADVFIQLSVLGEIVYG